MSVSMYPTPALGTWVCYLHVEVYCKEKKDRVQRGSTGRQEESGAELGHTWRWRKGELRPDDRLENEGDSQRNVCVSVHVWEITGWSKWNEHVDVLCVYDEAGQLPGLVSPTWRSAAGVTPEQPEGKCWSSRCEGKKWRDGERRARMDDWAEGE